MEDIVYEIIGGALILGIILVVIMVFRNGSASIQEAANSQVKKDIKIEQMIGVNGGTYGVAKIKEAFAYSKVSDIPVEIEVKNTVIDDEDDLNLFITNSSARYELEVHYYAGTSELSVDDTSAADKIVFKFK